MSAQLDRFLRERECRQLSGISRTTRWRLERKDGFPKRRQLSLGSVGWLESEVLEWMRQRSQVETQQPTA